MEQSLTERLKSIDWDDLLPRLLLYSRYLIKSRRLERMISPEDLVHNAIAYLMSSSRETWPTDLPLLTVLMGRIRSEASHISYLQKKRDSIPIEEEVILAPEIVIKDLEAKELRERILALVKDDQLLSRMVTAIFEEPHLRSSELAEILGIPIKELHMLKKRLRRKLSKLAQEEL